MSSDNIFVAPHNGSCWSAVVGATGSAKELLPMLGSVFNAVLGLFGLLYSKGVTEGGKILYSALFGYAFATFFFHMTLYEGFYRALDIQLNFLQAMNLVYISCLLKEKTTFLRVRSRLLTLVFTIYPFFLHVVGVTFAKQWIAWVAFDAVWAIVLASLLLVWCYRDSLGTQDHPDRQAMLNLVWNIIICVPVAYLFWILDAVVCYNGGNNNWIYVVFGQWLWLMFIGLGFYYMATLTIFLRAGSVGMYPIVKRWPKSKPFVLAVGVQYKPLSSHSNDESIPMETTYLK